MLTTEQIAEKIKNPKNAQALAKAKEIQNSISQYWNNQHPDIVYKRVEPLLISEKYKQFIKVFKNWPKPLVNKVRTHYTKIYESYGGVREVSFGENTNARFVFENIEKTIYEGISSEAYWKKYGHDILLTQPNSVFVTASKEDGLVIKHVPLKYIHDIDESTAGVDYAIFCMKLKDVETYYVYDDTFFYTYEKVKGVVSLVEAVPHGAGKCPVSFASNRFENVDEIIVKKSVLSDSLDDLLEYSILKTFYQNYKYFGSFPKEIRPQTRCEWKSEERNLACDGVGGLKPIRSNEPYNMPNGGKCTNCNKIKGMMGEILEIPISMQSNENFVKNLGNLYNKIEADSNILKVHAEDIKELEDKILADCIGSGFGQQFSQSVNEKQVGASLDDIESNLNDFAGNIEETWNFNISRAGEMYSSDFEFSNNKWGRQHFLKSTEQLYKELETLTDTSSDPSLIQQKKRDILLTESKNDPSVLKRSARIQQLKPWSLFTPEYITQNIATLQVLNPGDVGLYFYFDQALTQWETSNGRLEDFGTGTPEALLQEETIINDIRTSLKSIINSYGVNTSGAATA